MELKLTQDSTVVPHRKPKQVGVKPVSNSSNSTVVLWREELDSYYELMETFETYDVDEILRALSAMTARVSHIRSSVVRNENRQTQSFRTRELDPFLEEADRQFKIWSRILSIRSMDWEMSKREPT